MCTKVSTILSNFAIDDLHEFKIQHFKTENTERFRYTLLLVPVINDCVEHWKSKIRMIVEDNFLEKNLMTTFSIDNYLSVLINLRNKADLCFFNLVYVYCCSCFDFDVNKNSVRFCFCFFFGTHLDNYETKCIVDYNRPGLQSFVVTLKVKLVAPNDVCNKVKEILMNLSLKRLHSCDYVDFDYVYETEGVKVKVYFGHFS